MARETFVPSVKLAEDKGVTICFEPLAPSETDFVNTAAEGIEFIRQFDSDAFKIILDVKAMSSDSKPIADIIRDSHPNFAYFHANDANLKGPGFGDVDFKPIFGALKEVGYGGFVSVEVFDFEEGPETIAPRESALHEGKHPRKPKRLLACLQFVVEYGEAVDGGGLAAEYKRTKRDRLGTCADGVDFRRRIVAFRPDPDRQFARRLTVLDGVGVDLFAGVFCVGLQRGDQREIRLARIIQGLLWASLATQAWAARRSRIA